MGHFFWLWLLTVSWAWAYVPTVTPAGIPVRWKNPLKFNLVGNSTNRSGLSSDEVYHAVVMGLQRWKQASNQQVNFDYWQGTDPQTYLASAAYNGQSNVFFASNSAENTQLSANVLGLTQVWYNPDTGEILETDIIINDRDFHFTNNPRDTSGYGLGNSTLTEGRNNVYIQNVITHEFGHALGLSHSGGLQSTMLFMESPEQAHLGCDEMIAAHALFPSSDENIRGTLTGTVLSDKGTPVFGAHVLAISKRRGTVLATALTDKAGHYVIKSLEPGQYFILAEPFYAGPQALPGYYAQAQVNVCSDNSPFSRTFLTIAGELNTPMEIAVPVGISVEAPSLSVHCESAGGAAVPALSGSTSPIPIDGDFAILDKLSKPGVRSFELKSISGRLEIHALAFGLYSPIQASLSLTTSSGTPVTAQLLDPVFIGDSGYINHDSSLIVDGLPLGDYVLNVSFKKLQANDYPAGPIALDFIPFILLTGSLNQPEPPLGTVLPINSRCQMTENFPTYTSPPGPPPRSSTQQSGGGTGFCGTIQPSSKNRPEASLNTLLGWFIPWIFMFGAGRWVIRLQEAPRKANLKS